MHYKTGKKAAVHTPRRMRAMLALGAHLSALGPPPDQTYNRSAPRTKIGLDWVGMLGNNEFGDCVWADSGNTVTLITANVGATIVRPTLAQVLGDYSAVTGFVPPSNGQPAQNDGGTDENTAINYLRTAGLAGHRIDDSAPIDWTNLDYVRWAIALFFGVRLGIGVNDAYEQAFSDHQPWTAALPATTPDHDVRLVDYDASGVYAMTWGRDDQLITWDKVVQPGFIDEAHVELWYDEVAASGLAPNNLNLAQLDADLRAIGPEEARYTQNVTTVSDMGAVEAARHGVTRSKHWPTVEREAKAAHPSCHGCGQVGSVQVHHRFAFHEDILAGRPDVELTPSNFRNLCQSETQTPNNECHLGKGHLDDFKSWNPNLDADLARWQGRSLADLKNDPDWQAAHAARAKPWDGWTRDEKIAYRKLLDETFPIDGDECKKVVARFPETAPVPFDEWLASLPAA